MDERKEYVDWRGRIADFKKYGGPKATILVCVVEVLENMVFLSNAINFVTYFLKAMHYPSARAANMVANFMGTSFLLTIFGGFISDSFLGRFWTFISFCALELVGFIVLIIQAENTQLHPRLNVSPSKSQDAILYTGLYAMAVGVGGVKAALPAHGADQVLIDDHDNQDGIHVEHKHEHKLEHKQPLSTFFNWFFFSLCSGGLIAATFMVWIEENKGWNWSFKICAVALALALLIFASGFSCYRYKGAVGSPLTRIFKVFVSAARNSRVSTQPVEHVARHSEVRSNHKFKFLDKALADSTITTAGVEETKTFLGLLPIFACTILMNCCLAQLQTFTVQQGNIMNKKIHDFTIPTPSLTVFPLIIMLSSIPIYESLSRLELSQKKNNVFRPLWRIGLGLALASGSMAVAAMVEAKRRHAKVPPSVFWLSWQYMLLGVSDMLTLGGMLEFFYSEAPPSMRSICTSLSWCSTSMGYFLSSLLVSLSNAVSALLCGGKPWLGGSDLNHSRLDMFYTLLCVVNFLNFINYVYWAKRY